MFNVSFTKVPNYFPARLYERFPARLTDKTCIQTFDTCVSILQLTHVTNDVLFLLTRVLIQ